METYAPSTRFKTLLEVATRHLGHDQSRERFLGMWYAHQDRMLYASDAARIACIDLRMLDVDLACDRWCLYTDGMLWLFDDDLFGLPPTYGKTLGRFIERRSNCKLYDPANILSVSQLVHDHPSVFVNIQYILDLAGVEWKVWAPYKKGESVLFASDAMAVYVCQLKESV